MVAHSDSSIARAFLDEEAVIVARHVQHYFGEGENRTQVLFDNSFRINAGEIVIMTGPSGSGKTTLLTLIGALRHIQEGSLQVLGHFMDQLPPSEQPKLRRNIGFIFQQHNLFSSLTALENVRMAMELQQKDAKWINDRGKDILNRLGLAERIHYRPANLSGGQRQRVAIARALANHPRLVLADEPTAALDAQSGEIVMDLFHEMAEGPLRATILVVTHDKRLIDRASRIINMVRGRIVSNVVTYESIKICKALARIPAFTHLAERALVDLADRMKRELFPEGAAIFRQGEAGDRFYVIDKGLVEIVKDNKVIRELGEGEYFGELAIIEEQPRSATVRAKNDVELFTLSKDDFRAALAASEDLERRLRKVYMDRQ